MKRRWLPMATMTMALITACPLQAALSVTTVDGESFEGTPAAFDDGAVRFDVGQDAPRSVRLGDIAHIGSAAKADPSYRTGWLLLAGGDLVPANLLPGGEATGLRFRSEVFGDAAIAFKFLRGYLPASLAGSTVEAEEGLRELRGDIGRTDAVTYKNHQGQDDKLSGVVEKFEDGKLTVTADFGAQVDLDIDAVQRIAFSNEKFNYTAPNGPHVLVRTTGGAEVRGALKSIGAEGLTLSHVTGAEPSIPMDAIVRIDVLGGNLTPVAQLRPSDVREWTEDWGPHPFPHVLDANVWRREMTMNGRRFSTGLGVRAESEISYRLGGRFREFRATIGHDDIVSRAPGDIVFRVIGDGNTLFESETFTAGSKPQDIVVDVSDVTELTLSVRTPHGVSKGTMANWAEARLIKK